MLLQLLVMWCLAVAVRRRLKKIVLQVSLIGGLIAIVDEIDKENNRIVLDAEGVFLTFDLSRSIMKVITPAPSTETAETVKETIVEEDSAIESADEK